MRERFGSRFPKGLGMLRFSWLVVFFAAVVFLYVCLFF